MLTQERVFVNLGLYQPLSLHGREMFTSWKCCLYNGTPELWTPLGPGKSVHIRGVSTIRELPHVKVDLEFWGTSLTIHEGGDSILYIAAYHLLLEHIEKELFAIKGKLYLVKLVSLEVLF